MTRTKHTVDYQYRNHTYAFSADIAQGKVFDVILDNVTDIQNWTVIGNPEHIGHVTAFAREQWKGKPQDEFAMGRFSTRVVPDEGVLYKGDGYYIQRPGHPDRLMGPFETRALATNMAKGYSLAVLYNTKFPEPTMRFRHSNGTEYTVLAVSNLHSDKPEYSQRVFYQGANGRIWDKPLEDFMRKMQLIASAEVSLKMDTRKIMSAQFMDAEGVLCTMQEARIPGTMYLGIAERGLNKVTGEPTAPVMAIDAERARQITPYLIHFLRTGSMPEKPLGALNLAELHG